MTQTIVVGLVISTFVIWHLAAFIYMRYESKIKEMILKIKEKKEKAQKPTLERNDIEYNDNGKDNLYKDVLPKAKSKIQDIELVIKESGFLRNKEYMKKFLEYNNEIVYEIEHTNNAMFKYKKIFNFYLPEIENVLFELQELESRRKHELLKEIEDKLNETLIQLNDELKGIMTELLDERKDKITSKLDNLLGLTTNKKVLFTPESDQ